MSTKDAIFAVFLFVTWASVAAVSFAIDQRIRSTLQELRELVERLKEGEQ
jgi:hypothetical protein